MKKFASCLIVCALAGATPAFGITQNQGMVMPALAALKLEVVPNDTKLIGGPVKYRVTKATIEYLQKLLEGGNTLTLGSDGTLKVDKK